MEHVIGFPRLGWEFNITRTAFSLFGMPIYWYGIIICVGFFLGAWYISRRADEFGVTQDDFLNCLLIGVPSGIVGARIYYVLFSLNDFRDRWLDVFNIRRGGLAIYGGIIAVVIALAVYSRVKKIPFASLCDLAALGIIIGQCVGRWGNFINGEAHGDVTGLPWGMTIDGSAPVHPTYLYESLWNFVGFFILHAYSKKRKFKGEVALFYVAWYGLGRVWIEGLRTDSLYIGTFRVSQVLAGLSCIAAIAVIVKMRARIRVEKAFYVPPMQQAATDASDTKTDTPASADTTSAPADDTTTTQDTPAQPKEEDTP